MILDIAIITIQTWITMKFQCLLLISTLYFVPVLSGKKHKTDSMTARKTVAFNIVICKPRNIFCHLLRFFVHFKGKYVVSPLAVIYLFLSCCCVEVTGVGRALFQKRTLLVLKETMILTRTPGYFSCSLTCSRRRNVIKNMWNSPLKIVIKNGAQTAPPCGILPRLTITQFYHISFSGIFCVKQQCFR